MILGHQKQIEILKKLVSQKKVFQNFLFWGPEGIGKKQVALWFFSQLAKEKLEKNPDFIFLGPQNNSIKIEQIKELCLRLSATPILEENFFVLIDGAEKMTGDAQNCFLKTLEEPKAKTIFILISRSKESLLPTIVSRCFPIKFSPLPSSLIKKYFLEKGFSEKEAESLSFFCQGRMSFAKTLTTDLEKREFFRQKIKDLASILKGSLAVRFDLISKICQEGEVALVLEIWLSYLRMNLLKKVSHQETVKKLLHLLKGLQTLYFHLQTKNLNPKLALENLFFEI